MRLCEKSVNTKVVDLFITYNFAIYIFSIRLVVFPEIEINRFLPLKTHPLTLPDPESTVIYFSFHFHYISFLFQWVSSYYNFFSLFTFFKGFGTGLIISFAEDMSVEREYSSYAKAFRCYFTGLTLANFPNNSTMS